MSDVWCAELIQRTIFEPLQPLLIKNGLYRSNWPELEQLNALAYKNNVRSGGGKQIEFVSPTCHREGHYEQIIYLQGKVLTRPANCHDFFNAVVWLTYPRTKAALNRRHYSALLSRGVGNNRSKERDVMTLIDESGVVVACADPQLSILLKDFKWKELFWGNRAQVLKSMKFYVMGHGLYEKALKPFLGLTGKGIIIQTDPAFFELTIEEQLISLDTQLALQLSDSSYFLNTHCLSPVPILGYPGWDHANKEAAYYDNVHYFRPGKRKNQNMPS